MIYLPKDNNKTKGLGIFFLSLLSFLIYLPSCSQKNSGEEKIREMVAQSSSQFQLLSPTVPDSIKEGKEKQIYAGLHFWDNLNFRDTVQSLNQDFMEQNFSNFILHLHLQPDEEAVMKAFETMLDKASVSLKVLNNLKYIAKLYLADPNSPMRSEKLWIPYLKVVTSSDRYSSGAEKARLEFELEMASKNLPGSIATDFKYKLSDGKISSLHDTPIGSQGLIVIFYDPDCENCKELMKSLKENPKFSADSKNGSYTVLAVDINEDEKLWIDSLNELPSNWIKGKDISGILDNDLYYLPALPSIYIIGKQYKILVKEL